MCRCARDRRLVPGYRIHGIVMYGDGDEGFAMLSFGTGEVMFNSGGHPSTRDRREIDLYVYSDNVDENRFLRNEAW